MLSNARVLGHVFNPLTVYWCHDGDGSLRCVVAEVHNTYGGRHRYLLHTDERGRAQTGKEFYVSPFYEVAGDYTMSLPEPGERLALSVALHPPQGTSIRRQREGPATARPRLAVRAHLARPPVDDGRGVAAHSPAGHKAVPARAARHPAARCPRLLPQAKEH